MNLRVNLMKPGELRQPGALNPKVVMRISIFAGTGAIVLVVVLVLLHVYGVKRSLTQARARFKEVDPVFQDVRAMQMDLDTNRQLFEELQGWYNARFEWHVLLSDFGDVLPEGMQVAKLFTKASLTVIRPPLWDKKTQPVPARFFRLRLDGLSDGERGDEVALQFVRAFPESAEFKNVLKSVQLGGGLKRAVGRRGNEDSWLYAIEAESMPRKMEVPAAPGKDDKTAAAGKPGEAVPPATGGADAGPAAGAEKTE